MKTNMGGVDRGIRVVAGLAVLVAGAFFESYWGLIGVVLIATAAMGFCPPYAMLGINTCGTKK